MKVAGCGLRWIVGGVDVEYDLLGRRSEGSDVGLDQNLWTVQARRTSGRARSAVAVCPEHTIGLAQLQRPAIAHHLSPVEPHLYTPLATGWK